MKKGKKARDPGEDTDGLPTDHCRELQRHDSKETKS